MKRPAKKRPRAAEKHFSSAGNASRALPDAKRNQGRPRADLSFGAYAWEWLLWPTFKNWIKIKRKFPRGLPERTELWEAVPDKRRYLHLLAVLAFSKPTGSALVYIKEAYATSPDFTCEALLYLRARAYDLKARTRKPHLLALFDPLRDDSMRPYRRKLGDGEVELFRKMRRAQDDFMEQTGGSLPDSMQ